MPDTVFADGMEEDEAPGAGWTGACLALGQVWDALRRPEAQLASESSPGVVATPSASRVAAASSSAIFSLAVNVPLKMIIP